MNNKEAIEVAERYLLEKYASQEAEYQSQKKFVNSAFDLVNTALAALEGYNPPLSATLMKQAQRLYQEAK